MSDDLRDGLARAVAAAALAYLASRADECGIAEVLAAAWAKAEPDHPVTLHPASYVATWADIARALAPLLARQAVETRTEWGVKRDVATPMPSRESAEREIERQRNGRWPMYPVLVRRTVSEWEEVPGE